MLVKHIETIPSGFSAKNFLIHILLQFSTMMMSGSILTLTSNYSWMPSCRVDDSLLGGAVQDHLNTPFWAHGSAWPLWTQRLGLIHGHRDLDSS